MTLGMDGHLGLAAFRNIRMAGTRFGASRLLDLLGLLGLADRAVLVSLSDFVFSCGTTYLPYRAETVLVHQGCLPLNARPVRIGGAAPRSLTRSGPLIGRSPPACVPPASTAARTAFVSDSSSLGRLPRLDPFDTQRPGLRIEVTAYYLDP